MFLLVLPLNDMQGDKFYVGVNGIAASAAGLSLTLAARNEAAARVIGWGLAPLAIIAGLYFSRRQKSASQTALWLASTALAGSWVLLVIAHLATGMLLPVDRTGVYFFPLGGPGALLPRSALTLGARRHRLCPRARVPGATRCHALLGVALRRGHAHPAAGVGKAADPGKSEPLRLGFSWQLEPSVNFYRETQGWKWIEPASRRDVRPGLDAYLLIDQRAPDSVPRITVDRTGRASGTMLAFPSR